MRLHIIFMINSLVYKMSKNTHHIAIQLSITAYPEQIHGGLELNSAGTGQEEGHTLDMSLTTLRTHIQSLACGRKSDHLERPHTDT